MQFLVIGAALSALSGVWVGLADAHPAVAAAWRCLYALPVLALLAQRERAATVPGARRRGLLAGVLFGLNLAMFHVAIDHLGAGVATVLGSVQAVIVPLASWALLSQAPSRRQLQSIPVVLLGVVAVSGLIGGIAVADAHPVVVAVLGPEAGANPVLGAALGLGAVVLYSLFLLQMRSINPDGVRTSAALRDVTSGAAATTLAVVLLLGESAEMIPAWPSTGWLLVLGLGSQVVAWLMITRSLAQVTATTASLVLSAQPVAALAVGMTVLAERPTAIQAAGVAIIIAAVLHATGGLHTARDRVRSLGRVALAQLR